MKTEPAPPRSPGRPPVWPWGEMQVGESRVVPIERKRLALASYSLYGKKHGRVYVGRTVKNGFKVWRVE